MSDVIDPKALWKLSYGLYLVSSAHGGRKSGQIANTVFQITSEPPRIAVSLNKENLTHETVAKSGVFGVSILDESAPMTFIGLMGFKSGREVDKFKDVAFENGELGCPLVTEHALAILETRVTGTLDAGTHTIFLGDVVGAKVLREGVPLTYEAYHAIKKGKAPKTAPTYRKETEDAPSRSEKGTSSMKYVCKVCGYEYDPKKGDPEHGVKPGTDWKDVPADWVCPVCGAGKDEFEPA